MTLKVGIDIGGTKIIGGVVNAHGRIIEKVRGDTPSTPEGHDASEVADETVRVIDLPAGD